MRKTQKSASSPGISKISKLDQLFCEWLAEKDVDTLVGKYHTPTFPVFAETHGASQDEIKEFLTYGTQS